jgi:SAM-dependent methyltransferase
MGLFYMKINLNIKDRGGVRMKEGFKVIEKWIKDDNGKAKQGIDIGCGTDRLSMEVLAIDQNGDRRYAHADVIHNCKDLEIEKETEFNGYKYKFEDNELDFIFSSHCLEDFDNIPEVFEAWWKKIKKDGLMILLLPDMEICDCEICTSEARKEYMKKSKLSARYWTLEDRKKHKIGNPSHKTNVGKKFMTNMLQGLKEKGRLDYDILQMDTIPHDKDCSIDFVIKKLN